MLPRLPDRGPPHLEPGLEVEADKVAALDLGVGYRWALQPAEA
jgi:hypothetical protein